MGSLIADSWNSARSNAQFIAKGSSHELAALLITEVTRYSTICLKKPTWCLYINKFSAYDVVLKESVIPAALRASGGPKNANQILVYLSNRLNSRRTYLEYDKIIMGACRDMRGLEQGALLSPDEYQLVSNTELDDANHSGLGINVGPVHVAAEAAADDTVLFSNSESGL